MESSILGRESAVTAIKALLLTDVVDSTRLSETLGDVRMAEVWAEHDRVARDLLPAHRGREIDKTDGFLLLFDAASDALEYALAYHAGMRELSRHLGVSLAARAGLHVGPVILRENPSDQVARGAKPLEVEGLSKPTGARIMGLASGGQTLISPEARQAIGETKLRVESHGHWRMKGVSEPVELFEIGDGTAPFTPPPNGAKVYRVVRDGDHWIPIQHVKHSLPAERDAFVGRHADLLDLAQRLDDGARLVSILGIGGTGKTRLVTHYGWTWLGDWPGGVWFCDLSETRDPDGIAYAVARALDVPLGDSDPIMRLGHAIAGRGRCLVLLDNFEQVTACAAATLGRWLDRAAEAQFVVTTREVLNLPGEVTLALHPLPEGEAVRLFVARAVQAVRDFVLAEADREVVAELVRLLDGLPLAIELAAARVRVMSPKLLLQRMAERFKLLASPGGRPPRHATLRGALDWSWDLLSLDEQSALSQLAVFEGGFDLQAAEHVLSLSELWPADAVQALVDKSLVRRVSEERFSLLISVQEYASSKLDAEARSGADARHGDWFAASGNKGRHDLDNQIAAVRRAVARGDGDVAIGALQGAWETLDCTGPFATGLDLARAVRAMPGLDREAMARASRLEGAALRLLGRNEEARAPLEAALAETRGGDPRFEGLVRGQLASLQRDLGRIDDARASFEAALSSLRQAGDRRTEGQLLGNLAVVLRESGQMAEAKAAVETALSLARETGDRRFEGIWSGNLGFLYAGMGRADDAQRLFDDALTAIRDAGDRLSEGRVLGHRAGFQADQGRTAEARANTEAALRVAREVGDRRSEGLWLGSLGALHRRAGRAGEARAHYESALVIHREVHAAASVPIALVGLALVDLATGQLDRARAWAEEAVALAAPYAPMLAEALATLARTHTPGGPEARAAIDRACSLGQKGRPGALVAAVAARVAFAEGDLGGARIAIAEATKTPAFCRPGTDIADVVDEVHRLLEGAAGA